MTLSGGVEPPTPRRGAPAGKVKVYNCAAVSLRLIKYQASQRAKLLGSIKNSALWENIVSRSRRERQDKKKTRTVELRVSGNGICRGDPYGNRTHVFALRGRRLSRLTNRPYHRVPTGTHILYHISDPLSRGFLKKIIIIYLFTIRAAACQKI